MEISKMHLTVILTFIIRVKKELNFFRKNNRSEMFHINSVMFDYSVDVYEENKIIFNANSFQVYMNYKDIYELAEDSYEILKKLYPVNNLDYRILDEVYLEHMLGIDLPFLKSYSFNEYFLEDLFLYSHNEQRWKKILQSELYLSLKKNSSFENFSGSGLYFQNENERLQSALTLMENNAYGRNGQYIIIYNDSKMIKDGSHRAASLLYLYGNIKVRVMVLNFDNNFHSYNYFLAKGGKPEW